MSKAYIVLVNYTKYKDTIECLESILKLSYTNFQVILIDNSPDDISEKQITNWLNGNYHDIDTSYPELIYPLAPKPLSYSCWDELQFAGLSSAVSERILYIKAQNRGFAAANNLAFGYILKYGAQSEFVWVLNNDTVVDRNALQYLVDFYKTPSHSGYLLGSKLYFYHQKNVLQAVAGRYNKWLGSTYHIGEGEIDTGQYDNYTLGKDNYIIGASIFLQVAYLNKVGLMNEEYFLYYEELDWMQRGAKYGYKASIQPAAIIYHKEGVSIRDNNKKNLLSDYYSIVNRLKFTRQWYPRCTFTVMLGIVYALLKRLAMGKFKFVFKTGAMVTKILFR